MASNRARPSIGTGSPRRVVFLALPGVQLLDIAGPLDVFDTATRYLQHTGSREPGYRNIVAGLDRDVTAGSGVRLGATPIERVPGPIDTLVVTGAEDFAERSFAPRTMGWLERRAAKARRVASICTGAFLLGELGLLDGRRATTHWLTVDALRQRVPEADVQQDALYTKDGPIYTSAGITAGFDLALALVEEDLGHQVAIAVARILVMFLHRPGGQSQFSAALAATSPRHTGIRKVLDEVIEDPAGDHRVPAMARRAGMSPRHFVRVFTAEAGEPPARFVQGVRLERARQLLERTTQSVQEVALASGLGTAETMRRRFQKALGVSPAAYRARFRQAS